MITFNLPHYFLTSKSLSLKTIKLIIFNPMTLHLNLSYCSSLIIHFDADYRYFVGNDLISRDYDF